MAKYTHVITDETSTPTTSDLTVEVRRDGVPIGYVRESRIAGQPVEYRTFTLLFQPHKDGRGNELVFSSMDRAISIL